MKQRRRGVRLFLAQLAVVLSVALVFQAQPVMAQTVAPPAPPVSAVPPVNPVTTVTGGAPPVRVVKGLKGALTLAMLGAGVWVAYQNMKDLESSEVKSAPEDQITGSACSSLWSQHAMSGAGEACFAYAMDRVTLAQGPIDVKFIAGKTWSGATGFDYRITTVTPGVTTGPWCSGGPTENVSGEGCRQLVGVEVGCPGDSFTQFHYSVGAWNAGAGQVVQFTSGTKKDVSIACGANVQPELRGACLAHYGWPVTAVSNATNCVHALQGLEAQGGNAYNPTQVVYWEGQGERVFDAGMGKPRVNCGGVWLDATVEDGYIKWPACSDPGGPSEASVTWTDPATGTETTFGVTRDDVLDLTNGGCTSILSCQVSVEVYVGDQWRSCYGPGVLAQCTEWWVSVAEGLARCRYGGETIPRTGCEHLRYAWRTNPDRRTEVDTELDPKLDPDGNLGPKDPDVKVDPPTQPTAGPNPEGPVANPDSPEVDPNTQGCFGGMWSWNPVDWVFVPVKCALMWAFVPPPGYLAGQVESLRQQVVSRPPGSLVVGVGTALVGMAEAFAGAGGCGVLADFTTSDISAVITCAQIQAVPGWGGLYALVQLGLWGVTALACFRMVTQYFEENGA